MTDVRSLLFVLLCVNVIIICMAQNRTDESKVLSRRKRYLVFPEGSNVQLVYCLEFGTFVTEIDIIVGGTAAVAYELPNSFDKKITKYLHRRSRSIAFPKIEAFLHSAGLDGKACVMKALCEASQRDPEDVGKGTLVQELLHVIFTLPRDGGRFERSEHQAYEHAYRSTENCEQLYPSCSHSIYDLEF